MKITFVEEGKSIFDDDTTLDAVAGTSKLPAGTAQWTHQFHDRVQIAGLMFICPCGCKKLRSVPVIGDRKWNWNGDKVNPTLTPSILIIGACGWHGFLTNGEWRTV